MISIFCVKLIVGKIARNIWATVSDSKFLSSARLTIAIGSDALEAVADTLASPLAFELCEGGTCGDPRPDAAQKTVSCPQSDTCSKGGCYCQLFERRKGAADKVPWKVAPTNHDNEVKYKPDRFDYKCLCVKPILEGESVTIDGEKYATRFVLCGSGTCALSSVVVIGEGPHGEDVRHETKCTGSCERDCKCTLFRLQVAGGAGFDPKKAKWEYVAKADKQVLHDTDYIYRCFCLK
jgi:hypothetical protein